MPVKIKKNLDSIRCHFLWQDTSTKKRFALIKWTKICMPRQFGGLGILDLHCMNISLLLKWWWKLKDHQYHSIWKQIILVKYFDNMPIKQQSAVWKEINALSQLGQTGSSVVLGNGQDTTF
jgi:hypothetical protein